MLCAVLAALIGPFLASYGPQEHARLMIFGFAGAAIGAYMLTVLPGWTKVRATPLQIALLAALWLAGRLFPGPAEALYFLLLAAILAPPVVQKRIWDRIWAPLGAFLLGAAALLPELTGGVPPLLVAALIAVVGGKALPAFLASAADCEQPPDHVLLRIGAALCLLGAALWPHPGWYLAAVACLVWQLLAWPLKVPPVGLMLLPPWLWLCTALLLMAQEAVSPSLAMHALTMGGIGGMVQAFFARVFARRIDGGALEARALSLAAAAALHCSVAARLLDALPLSYWLWALAWMLTLVQLIGHLWQPHKIPVFIGTRRKSRMLRPDQAGW
jgi:uncharacterized protein involved in response to NO